MKILITGGTGQVGFELQRSLQLHGECSAPSRAALDLFDANSVDEYLANQQPDLIVNAAAYTAVDKAETDFDNAQRLNAELPKQLANYCRAKGAALVHYSSDYVYPGNGNKPWQEDSPTDPQNKYGESKLAGDLAVMQSGCKHLIFRTSWVYSARGNNFMKTMLKLGAAREALSIVDDQIGAPTPARLIANVTALAISKPNFDSSSEVSEQQSLNIPDGLYHLAPSGETSWKAFAESIFSIAKAEGLELSVEAVKGIPTVEYPTPAKRPLNSRMSMSKLEQALGLHLPDWQSQLELTVKEYLA